MHFRVIALPAKSFTRKQANFVFFFSINLSILRKYRINTVETIDLVSSSFLRKGNYHFSVLVDLRG